MYSSPGTPTGTGSIRASSTYAVVFEIGSPIGTLVASSESSPTACHVANVVVSVGP